MVHKRAMNIHVSTETLDDRIAALCAGQPPDHSLRQAFYNDPEIFEADIERLFLRHWLCAGHESLAPNPGDYFLYEMAQESIIVIRGQ
ncbi:MAG: aromatic ring-hydroxylating dioxygenase subunit alpha, partial [Roseiarcus sp.]